MKMGFGNQTVWFFLGLACILAGCNRGDRPDAGPQAKGATMGAITVQSPSFANGQPIPKKFTGEGEDVSPALSWSGLPAGTREIALICDDPDAPTPEPWVHWVIYKIPAATTGLPDSVPPSEKLSSPAGVMQGNNTWPAIGYKGPMPPKGHGVHHYHFKVYAIDAGLDIKPGLSKKELLKAMQGHILAEGELIGTYQRK